MRYNVIPNVVFCSPKFGILWSWMRYNVISYVVFCSPKCGILWSWILYYVTLNIVFCDTECAILGHWILYSVILYVWFCDPECVILRMEWGVWVNLPGWQIFLIMSAGGFIIKWIISGGGGRFAIHRLMIQQYSHKEKS